VYKNGKLAFSSVEDGLSPLLEYIGEFAPNHHQVVIFDRIVGNAAALLAVEAQGTEVYSSLGSRHAIKTLEKYGLKYHFTDVVAFIQRAAGKGMCPMEELSLGREPEEFLRIVKSMLARDKC
jgi:hypothetical protein